MIDLLYYKYLGTDRFDVLEGSRIRFSQGSILNDPYELRPNIESYQEYYVRSQLSIKKPPRSIYHSILKEHIVTRETRSKIRKLRKSNPEKFQDFLVDLIRGVMDSRVEASFRRTFDTSMLVLSLSRRVDNQLMWSHYAEGHKGFVIGFDSEILTDHLVKNHYSSLPFEVAYSNKRYRVPKEMLQPKHEWPLIGVDGVVYTKIKVNVDFPFDLFSTKSLDWAYEEEVRYFAPAHAGEPAPESANSTHPVYLYKFPGEAIKQIIIGSAADADFVGRIREVRDRKFPGAQLLRATPDPDTFKMRIEPPVNFHPTVLLATILHKHGLIGEFRVGSGGSTGDDPHS